VEQSAKICRRRKQDEAIASSCLILVTPMSLSLPVPPLTSLSFSSLLHFPFPSLSYLPPPLPLKRVVRGSFPGKLWNSRLLQVSFSTFWHAKGGLQMCVFLGRGPSLGGDGPSRPLDPPLQKWPTLRTDFHWIWNKCSTRRRINPTNVFEHVNGSDFSRGLSLHFSRRKDYSDVVTCRYQFTRSPIAVMYVT